MSSWVSILDTDEEAVVGSSDPYRAAGKALQRQLDDIELIRTRLVGVVEDPVGFEGLAADAYADITDAVVDQLAPLADPLEAWISTLHGHADELDDLVRRSDDELAEAVDRVDRLARLEAEVDDLEEELARAGDDSAIVGLELQAAERRARRAEDEVARSLRAHRLLRLDEDDLNARTEATLGEHPVPTFEPVVSGLGRLFTHGPSVGVPVQDPVWHVLRQSLLAAGIDVSYPAAAEAYEHAEGCIWMDNGVQYIEVGGPYGGTFAVGTDISPGVYSVLLHLLNGKLPDVRPWDDPSELSDAESAAFWWAASTNWPNPGQAGQTQVMGVNGSLQSYYEGGDWSPQQLWSTNSLDMAINAATGSGAGLGHLAAGSVVAGVANGYQRPEPGCDDDEHRHGDANHHHG